MMTEEVQTNTYTLAEVANHSSRESCWLAIHGKVYDVTAFLEEHPGGDDIVLENAGRDATEEFEDIGHSNSAREMLLKYEVGVCPERDPKIEAKKQEEINFPPVRQEGGAGSLIRILLPIVIVVLAILYSLFSKATPVAESSQA